MSPDLMIEPKAKAALATNTVHALRDLQVVRDENALTITGNVPSFYHKQLAQEAVMAVANGLKVVNTVEVLENS